MTDSSNVTTLYDKNSGHTEVNTDDEEYDEDDYLINNKELISNISMDHQSLSDSFDDDEDDGEGINSKRSDFNGMKIVDNINLEQKTCYLKIKINGKVKYIHKQTACWILTDENERLPADRLFRVMKTSKTKTEIDSIHSLLLSVLFYFINKNIFCK